MAELLPAIFDNAKPRPGHYSGAVEHFVPDEKQKEFWGDFYENLYDSFSLNLPFSDADKKVNPYFGYFGLRYHPKKQIPDYFHVGLDLDGDPKTKVFPVADGILEYSGFGLVNGKYVMLSHPEIKTEDGFVLHSLYMHLRDLKVSFNPYQKMLREVSFNVYPLIPIDADCPVGLIGQTGNAQGYPHLHLQLEFRNEKGDIVLIDPLRAVGMPEGESLAKGIKDKDGYKAFMAKYKGEMLKTNLRDFVKKHL